MSLDLFAVPLVKQETTRCRQDSRCSTDDRDRRHRSIQLAFIDLAHLRVADGMTSNRYLLCKIKGSLEGRETLALVSR
jgi:hypothetical protein